MKRFLPMILLAILWLAVVHANTLSFPAGLMTAFPGIDQQYSTVNFNVQNAFNGIFLWRTNKTLTTPVTVTIGSTTIAWCTQQLQGLYYNNQRGFRLWPLDQNTLTGMQAIDPSYNALTLTWGLFTNCSGSGVSSQNVYGALGHIRGGHTYRILGGVAYDFPNKTWVESASGSWTKLGSAATGRLFDSQWSIGQFATWTGTSTLPICSNNATNYPACNQCATWYQLKNGQCVIKTSGGGWTYLTPDNCPDGDFSSSYYDRTCGTAPVVHGSAPIGKACKYDDEKYLANGSFSDTIGHRWFPYSEVMRVSCLHRWIGTKKGLWIYAPNANITRAEVIKTVVKILGIEFDNFSVLNEDLPYVTGDIPFADVTSGNRFAHYANYAYTQGLTEWLYITDKNGNKFFDPDKPINRYEAIKVIMLAYKKINMQSIQTNKPTVLSDIVNPNDPYYNYVREAEALWFVSGIPQSNGGYNFAWQKTLTRAEFAKIVSVPFAQQLFDVQDVVMTSQLYVSIVQALSKTTSDKVVFINTLFNKLNTMSDTAFMKAFTIDKKTFLNVLKENVMIPILEQ